ncbi:MAG: hypothetical protein ACREDH_16490 [Methylocella sp.]
MPDSDELFKRRHCGRKILVLCVAGAGIAGRSLRNRTEMMAGRGIYLARMTIMRGIEGSVPEFEMRGNPFPTPNWWLLAGRRNQCHDHTHAVYHKTFV